MSEQEDTLLEFPCEFPIKAMGPTGHDLIGLVYEIMQRHVDDLDASQFSSRQSSGGKYISVTVRFEAHSKQQLDAIYRELSAHELIKYVL